jgi:hypothetical protein
MAYTEAELNELFGRVDAIPAEAFGSFEEAQLDRLEEFDRLCRKLSARSFIQEGVLFELRASPEANDQTIAHAGEDSMDAALMDFRRFWMRGERTRFEGIHQLLVDHVDRTTRSGPEALGMLSRLGKAYDDMRADRAIGREVSRDPLTIETAATCAEVLDDWLYGDRFHGDSSARERVARWKQSTYEFTVAKIVNRAFDLCLTLDVVILKILDARRSARGSAAA